MDNSSAAPLPAGVSQLQYQGDFPRSCMGDMGRHLVASLDNFPFVVEVAAPGVGSMRLTLWNSSVAKLNSCHYQAVWQVPVGDTEPDWDAVALAFEEFIWYRALHEIEYSSREYLETEHDIGPAHVVELLDDIFVQHTFDFNDLAGACLIPRLGSLAVTDGPSWSAGGCSGEIEGAAQGRSQAPARC